MSSNHFSGFIVSIFGGNSIGGRIGGEEMMMKIKYAHKAGKTIIAVAMIVFRVLDGACSILLPN